MKNEYGSLRPPSAGPSEKNKLQFEDDIIRILQNKLLPPMDEEDMVDFLQLKGKDIGHFISDLDELTVKGQIVKTKKGKYFLSEQMHMYPGILTKHRRGFGFVITEDGDGDIYIGENDLAGAMSYDRVLVQLLDEEDEFPWDSRSFSPDGRRREGRIVRILERGIKKVIGNFYSRKRNGGYVVPDSKKITDRIRIKEEHINGAKDGDKVVVNITTYPQGQSGAYGKIIEILGHRGDAQADIKGLLRQYNIPEAFSPEVTAEANAIQKDIMETDLKGRRDLREARIITMDGADAKDLDDAVSIKKLENGNYKLGVHIADVTNYVSEDSMLDKEAMKRGCSVYLIDVVIPMLPKALSNGICSLNPHVDRLTLSVEMEIDQEGNVVSHEIFESIIRSQHRMIYTDVSDMLEDHSPSMEEEEFLSYQQALREKFSDIYPDIQMMSQLASILRKKRDARGSLDFDLDEAHITLDEDGIPITIGVAERRTANRLIEEFMLIANETIAEHFFWMDSPFVYRVHEKPSLEKMEAFKQFVGKMGYSLKGSLENIHPKALAAIIKKTEGRPEETIINRVMLRSMKKAFYDIYCDGHFGLAVKYYCHFTSPIRRYPDLMIHRIIKEQLKGNISDKRKNTLRKRAEEASKQASLMERNSIEIERELEKLKMAQYMENHIGEVYDGIISGVANGGFFVQIEKTIEGMVQVKTMTDDYYILDQQNYCLVGQRSNKVYSLGDPVRVEVSSVDLENREIYFLLKKSIQ